MASDDRLWDELRDEFGWVFQDRAPSTRLFREAVVLNCVLCAFGFLVGFDSQANVAFVLFLVFSVPLLGILGGLLTSIFASSLLEALFSKKGRRPFERSELVDAFIAPRLRRWGALVVLGVLPLYGVLIGLSLLGWA